MMLLNKRDRVLIMEGRNSGKVFEAQRELLEELEAYRAIGTVEELRELKEKIKTIRYELE